MTKDLKAAFEAWLDTAFPHLETYGVEGFGGKVYRSAEAANLSIAFQAGAKHILELVESEGIGDSVGISLINADKVMPKEEWMSEMAKATQKTIADEIRKGM